MLGRLSGVELSSEPRRTALRWRAAFGNIKKPTTRLGGVGHKPT
jgi:hypothetical protein